MNNHKRCVVNECTKFAQGKTDKCKGHGGGVRCCIKGCTKSAEGKTNKCKGHGGGVRCCIEGCTKSAVGKSGKCIEHGGGVRCNFEGCTKSAVGKSDKCKGHGGGVRCSIEGCIKSARCKTDKCIEHGGGVRCSTEGCTKSARCKSDKCKGHGGGMRCSTEGCTKSAVDKTGKCKRHGGGMRCSTEGCTKSARCKSDKCVEHGGGMRCPNCIDWVDSRCGDKKYDGYCATCFKRLFPTDVRSTVIYSHSKEIRVRNAIATVAIDDERFRDFIHDKPIYTGNCECTHRRRVDHRKLINGTMLAIETDEFAHRLYDEQDENIRYDDLYMVYSGKWIFIRFNPDGDKAIDFDDKINILLETIGQQIDRINNYENTHLLEIFKLFY
jgi:hypothetical protein